MMKLAIKTCTLDMPYTDMLDFCVEQGVSAVEIGTGNWSGAPHIDLEEMVSSETARQRWMDELRRRNLELCALNCSGNPLAYEKEWDVTEKTFRLAEKLGVKKIVMMSGLPGGCPGDSMPNWVVSSWPPETQEILNYQWSVAIPQWEKIVELANHHGVERLALELHGWQLVYNTETFCRLRDAVGDTVGVNLDPSHLFWMGADPIEMAGELAGSIYHVHIKDVRIEPAAGKNTLLDTKGVLEFASRSWNYVTPGSGHDESWWRRFVGALKAAGYDGPLSIEQEDYTIPTMDALRQGAALMRKVLA